MERLVALPKGGKNSSGQNREQLSESRYKRLFESAKDGIVIIDAIHHKIIEANPAAAELLEVRLEDIIGVHLFDISPFKYCARSQAEFYRLLESKTVRFETYILTRSDDERYFEVQADLYDEVADKIIQFNLRDITSRKQAEELKLKTQNLLAERQKLVALNTAKDEFISLASHQLRTPATIVKQYVGLILHDYMGDVPPQQRLALQKAYESNERQIQIINALLLVARVDAGKLQLNKESTNLVKLLKEVALEQPEITRRKQNIVFKLPRSLTALIDQRYFRMVLENLISNASKYSPKKSIITIVAKKDKGNIMIEVIDQGVGISETDQSKLYQKFSRIYNKQTTGVTGTGLGLYWSKKIVQLHDGELYVISKPSEGSTFRLILPEN